jgi:tetratricopeptide (TPR) repeat protein
LPLEHHEHQDVPLTPAQLLAYAEQLEDEGEIELAVDAYRAALAAGGPRADICFRLAELLYLLGDTSAARERYYVAIELDEDFVEARANLGCVLAEMGQPELALAAFRGALAYHPEYPDVHYHLARMLDELGRSDDAREHWQQFLRLSPDSPWADEARERLG